MSLSLILNIFFKPSSSVLIADFERVKFAGIVRYFDSVPRKQKTHSIFKTFQRIQDHSLFHTETNQYDL